MLGRRAKQQKFLNAVQNHYGWQVGFGKRVNIVWFQVSKNRRVYVQVIMGKTFREEVWNNQKVLVLPLKQVQIVRVGAKRINYDLIMQGITVPIDGQARKGSSFEAWLTHVNYLSRGIVNHK